MTENLEVHIEEDREHQEGRRGLIRPRMDLPRRIPVEDPVEKLALGRAPDDERRAVSISNPARRSGGRDPVVRVEMIRAYLQAVPAARERYATESVWEGVEHDRRKYGLATAEMRADLLSRAALRSMQCQAEEVHDRYLEMLEAYLREAPA